MSKALTKAAGLKRGRSAITIPSKWSQIMKRGVGIPRSGLGMLGSHYNTRVPELKFVDLATTTKALQVDTVPPAALNLFSLVQGAFGYQRIGQRVQLKSIRIRGHIQPTASQANASIMRVIVVYDRQSNAAVPLWTDVIGSVTAAGAASSLVRDGMNLANRERFIMLCDEQLYAPGNTDTAGVYTAIELMTSNDKNPSMFNFDRFIRLHNLETHFNNTNGGTIADIQTGSLILFFGGDSVAANWEFHLTARVRYQDI